MIKNNAIFSITEIAAIFGPDNIINTGNITEFSGVSTDSRDIHAGSLFIALKGEKFDGHDKIREAITNGALAAVAERKWFEQNLTEGLPLIIVEDSLESLGRIAYYHRKRFSIPVIAIAGSNGKTTTKEMTAHILSSKYNLLSTYANFNNRVGVPMMLLQLNNSHEAAVIEIGTNEPGEISILSEIAAPTHGLITNIGEEHLEKLIDLTGVEMEETSLFGYLKKHGGFSLINSDDPRLLRYEMILDKKFRFGTGENADLIAEFSFSDDLKPELKLTFSDEIVSIKLKTTGISTEINALAAVSVAIALNMTLNEIKTSLEQYTQPGSSSYGRMKYEKAGNINILNDTYNSNPSSASLALDTLKQYKTKGRKIAALADMLELGGAAAESHRKIILKATESADFVFLYGPQMQSASKDLDKKDLFHFSEKIKLSDYLFELLEPEDIILVKGSRGMKMEDVVIDIKNKFE